MSGHLLMNVMTPIDAEPMACEMCEDSSGTCKRRGVGYKSHQHGLSAQKTTSDATPPWMPQRPSAPSERLLLLRSASKPSFGSSPRRC